MVSSSEPFKNRSRAVTELRYWVKQPTLYQSEKTAAYTCLLKLRIVAKPDNRCPEENATTC